MRGFCRHIFHKSALVILAFEGLFKAEECGPGTYRSTDDDGGNSVSGHSCCAYFVASLSYEDYFTLTLNCAVFTMSPRYMVKELGIERKGRVYALSARRRLPSRRDD